MTMEWQSKLLRGVLLGVLLTGCTAAPVAPVAPPVAEVVAPTAVVVATEVVIPTEVPAPTEVPVPKRIVVGQSVDVQSWEPSNVNSRAEANILHHLYGTLFEITELGVISPYLAESYKTSADGLEFTFKLREGLVCEDGEALTAEDVKYTFDRAADKANEFTGNTAGFVLGALAFKRAFVEGDLNVTIVSGNFSSAALGLISEVFIHCKDSYSKMSIADAAAKPVGSGAYRFVEWVKDDYALLAKVPGFTLKNAAYDEIEWKVIPESSTRAAEMIAGNVDIITNVPPDQHKYINASGRGAVKGVQGTRRMYIGFNQRDAYNDTEGGRAIKKTDVRVALQYAIDVPTICKTLLSLECERASSMVNKPNDNAKLTPYPYDPIKAGELLDKAGYPKKADGTRFAITFMAGRGRYLNDVAVVQALNQYLLDVGIATDLQVKEWGSEFVPALRKHEVGPLFFVGTGGATWNAVYEMSDLSAPDAKTNYTEWKNPEWFELYASLGTYHDAAAEKVITDKMLEVMYNDPPWLFLYFQPDFYGVGADVEWEPRRDEILDLTTAQPK